MANILRSYRFGIIALQSIRALEAVARSPRGLKVCKAVHVFMRDMRLNPFQLKQRCGRHYSTSGAQPLGHGILTSDQVLLVMVLYRLA